ALVRRVIEDYFHGGAPEVSPTAAGAAIAGLLYVVCPYDALPDAMPLGLLDDVVVVSALVGAGVGSLVAHARSRQRATRGMSGAAEPPKGLRRLMMNMKAKLTSERKSTMTAMKRIDALLKRVKELFGKVERMDGGAMVDLVDTVKL